MSLCLSSLSLLSGVVLHPLFLPTLGMGELAFILLLVLLLFGPGKLPQAAKALGDGLRQFKSAVSGKSDANATADPSSDDKPPVAANNDTHHPST